MGIVTWDFGRWHMSVQKPKSALRANETGGAEPDPGKEKSQGDDPWLFERVGSEAEETPAETPVDQRATGLAWVRCEVLIGDQLGAGKLRSRPMLWRGSETDGRLAQPPLRAR